MVSEAERAALCLSLTAYAGTHGDPARSALALHRKLGAWLSALAPIRDHRIIWGPTSFRLWWQPSATSMVVFVTAPADDSCCYVVVRGGNPLAVWDASIENLGCLEQEPWLWARGAGSLAPAVCSGVRRQLDRVREQTPDEQLPGAGRTLAEFLAARIESLAADRKLPVHVCGHGLGGALALVVALWLCDTKRPVTARDLGWDPHDRAKLHCTAFAGPAVGNGDFATYASERLGERLELIHNSLDHAVALWDTASLPTLAELYRPHVPESVLVRSLVGSIGDEIERRGLEYEQPPARMIDGELNTSLPPSYAAQAEYQHLHAYVESFGLAELLDIDAILERPSGTDDGPVAQ
jgi:pimeloyl-ACP methyl ester carboxylesterase